MRRQYLPEWLLHVDLCLVTQPQPHLLIQENIEEETELSDIPTAGDLVTRTSVGGEEWSREHLSHLLLLQWFIVTLCPCSGAGNCQNGAHVRLDQRWQHWVQWSPAVTNQRLVLLFINQSEISIIIHQPIRN